MYKARRRHSPIVLMAAVGLIAVSILFYRSERIGGITLAVGSTTIALVVLAHLGVVAAVIGTLVAWRRRRPENPRKTI